ncbi:hypothetical protein Ancab_012715 [Ancistrocladus abbreviatus]
MLSLLAVGDSSRAASQKLTFCLASALRRRDYSEISVLESAKMSLKPKNFSSSSPQTHQPTNIHRYPSFTFAANCSPHRSKLVLISSIIFDFC